jgi:enolase-phosphatase E1
VIDGIGAVLLDIEGTTTPIAFVHERLFSYAKESVHAFLAQTIGSDADIDRILDGLREEHARDLARGESPPPWPDQLADASATTAAASAYVCWLIDRDRKSGPLKALQGRIWEGGYASGRLKGEVYPDVPDALRRWTTEGVRVGIFSSGSVLAQQLLFKHSTAGDLTPFLTWYFDTTVGPKRDPDSYRRIAAQIGLAPDRILFLSDTEEEVAAARTAGLQTQLVVRAHGDHLQN